MIVIIDKHKKIISMLTALAITVPMLTAMPAFADDPDPSDPTVVATPTPPPVTVVGKRVKDDDTYFEISLEVNEDYEDYTKLGVVLEYDPSYIIPAASWDDDADAADMTDNTDWNNRRALPTLGKDTWTAHTAFVYQEYKTESVDNGSGGTVEVKTPTKGYLFLGAEYPGELTKPEESTDPTPDPTEIPEDAPEPTPEPAQGTQPIVVARFMYNTAGGHGETGAEVKADLVAKWLQPDADGNPGANNWDKDWTKNKILTLAPDGIAGDSEAGYAYARYRYNNNNSIYMREFPTPEPTIDPNDTTATPRPVKAYNPVQGAELKDEEKTTDEGELEIITVEGESAKAGGLKLSDIYVILFFDWDDSLLGTLTAGVGQDPTESVHNYVASNFVHPDLRPKDVDDPNVRGVYYPAITGEKDDGTGNMTANTDWKQRKYGYRGEYPEEKPDSTDPLAKTGAYGDVDGVAVAERGSAYPLTNKLDYVFAGKNLVDEDHPYVFAYGWTQVVPMAPDYSDKKGHWPEILPKQMSANFTAFDPRKSGAETQTYDWAPELDENGEFVDSEITKVPTWTPCEFDKITQEDLKASDGNLYVKAVYLGSEWLGKNNSGVLSNAYNTVGPETIQSVGLARAGVSTYEIGFKFERINTFGHGVGRTEIPLLNMSLTQDGASASTPLKVTLDNTDVIPVVMTPTNAVRTVGYELWDKDILSGAERSEVNGLGAYDSATKQNAPFKLLGKDGMIFKYNKDKVLDTCYEYAMEAKAKNKTYADLHYSEDPWSDAGTWSGLRINKTSTAKKVTAVSGNTNLKYAQIAIVSLITAYLDENPTGDYHDITWYQMQYYVLLQTGKAKGASYCTSDDAISYLSVDKYSLMLKEYEDYN